MSFSLKHIHDVYVLEPNTDEQDLLIIEPFQPAIQLGNVNLDLAALLGAATIRLYMEVDEGGPYRRRFGTGPLGGVLSWTPADGGAWVTLLYGGTLEHPLKVTIQSALPELAQRVIPYVYGYIV